MVRRASGERAERRGERLDVRAEMEAKEGDISFVLGIALVEILSSVGEELKMMKKHHYSSMVFLRLMQKELGRMRGELKEKNFLIESLRGAAEERKQGGEEQERRPGEVIERRRYVICVQECSHGFARVAYNRVLEYGKLEMSELWFDWESVARSLKNRSEIAGRGEWFCSRREGDGFPMPIAVGIGDEAVYAIDGPGN